MILKAQSRNKQTLELDTDRGARDKHAVILNTIPSGANFRNKHLEVLVYLLRHENKSISYNQIAKALLWKVNASYLYGPIYKTISQVIALIGEDWIKHKPNVSVEFCTLVRTERPANEHVLLKESKNVPVEINGTIIASLWVPPFRQPPSALAENKELSLLLATTAITDLTGRDDLWQDCLRWCEDSSLDPVSVFCITGHGGSGKTRFALELVHHLRTLDGWDARFVRFERGEVFDLWAATVGPNDVLLVFDYASDHARAIADSLRFLAGQSSSDCKRRLRIILLARTANWESGWLEPFLPSSPLEFNQSARNLFRPNNPIMQLLPLSIEDRIGIFLQAYRRAADLLDLPAPAVDLRAFQRSNAKQTLTNPLSLIMAAVVGIRNSVPSALSLPRTSLAYEASRLFVSQRLRLAFPENPTLALHIMAYATLSSGLSLEEALSALELESKTHNLGTVSDPSSFVIRLAAWFPGEEGNLIGAIEPDILGEAFVLDQLSPRPEKAKDSILRIARTRAPQLIQFLIRAVQDFGTTETGSRAEPLRWLTQLADNRGGDDVGLLSEIAEALPNQSVALRPFALSIIETICGLTPDIGGVGLEKGELKIESWDAEIELLSQLMVAQWNMGDWDSASHSAEKLVTVLRELTNDRRNGDYHDAFIASLIAATHIQYARGKSKAAFANAIEAVDLCRELLDPNHGVSSDSDSASLKSLLAEVLVILSLMQADAGQFDTALPNGKEAVEVLRKLSNEEPEEFFDAFVKALSNLSAIQIVHEPVDSLANAREAVVQYRTLTSSNRDAFLPSLARSLRNLAGCEFMVNRTQAALASGQEGVNHYRDLLKVNRKAFLYELARGLSLLSDIQCDAGQYDDALKSMEEAVTYYREHKRLNPRSLLPELQSALSDLRKIKRINQR